MKDKQRFTARTVLRSTVIAATAAGLLVLAGCATPPEPPTQALTAAESAIAKAEQARVADYASTELRTARQKLDSANIAVRNEEMVEARYLALEAEAHAELAMASADELKAKAINDDMQKSIETLKQEMQRASGGYR